MSKNSTKTIFSFLLFSAIFAFIAACGDGSSTEASNDDSAMESTWVSLDNIDSSDAVMATKTLDNGIKLHFDKRELKGKEISVNYRKAMPESLQENAFGLTIYAGVEFAPGGLTFDVPIEVTLPLNKKPDTDSLLVLYYNEKERVWEATDMAVVQGKNVVFHVNHFSLYAVVDKNINDMLDYFDKLINDATDNLEKCPGEEKLTKEVKKFVDYIDGKDGYNLAEARGIITYPKTSCGKVEGYFASAQIYNDSEKKESFCFGGDSKKEDTDHLTLIHKTDSQMGKTEKEKNSSEYQKIFDRGFSIFYGPAESTLEATASTTSLGEGETATIEISNMCGEDPMEGYVIKVKTSGNMEKVDKGDIVIGSDGKATLKVKMTDASENGWVELTTTSLADEKLVTKQKIEFEADTSTAETWEMSLDVEREQQVCSFSSCIFKSSYNVKATFSVESPHKVTIEKNPTMTFGKTSVDNDKKVLDGYMVLGNDSALIQSNMDFVSSITTNNGKFDSLRVYLFDNDRFVFLRFSDYFYAFEYQEYLKVLDQEASTTSSGKLYEDPLILFSLSEGVYKYDINSRQKIGENKSYFAIGYNSKDEIYQSDDSILTYGYPLFEENVSATLTLKRIK